MSEKNKNHREQRRSTVRTMLAWTGDNPDREG